MGADVGTSEQPQCSAGSVNAGRVIAVLVSGSVERMVSYYACLYSGHAFCPLEAGWPTAVCEKALVSSVAIRRLIYWWRAVLIARHLS